MGSSCVKLFALHDGDGLSGPRYHPTVIIRRDRLARAGEPQCEAAQASQVQEGPGQSTAGRGKAQAIRAALLITKNKWFNHNISMDCFFRQGRPTEMGEEIDQSLFQQFDTVVKAEEGGHLKGTCICTQPRGVHSCAAVITRR
jgi:hypothetical protein